ncbi:CD2-associated protein isoform X2 [Mobula birostris]|uniref:CD2-associated protein isoform X2 n=1 Tax=Mobula birostris TaxID=1983395 RepID=UPI003B27D7A5
MVEVTVEYDYDAAQEDELTLRVGDVIKNVRKLEEEGWCEGELNGKRGLFPDNFVKAYTAHPRNTIRSMNVHNGQSTNDEESLKEVKRDTDAKEENQVSKREKSGNVANLVQRMSTFGLPIGFPSHPRSLRRRRSKKRHCEATFNYIPQNEDELEIKMGDVIEVIEEVEEGWWKGILNEKTGLFPSNFVKELIDQNEDGETDEVLSDPDVLVKDLIGVGPSSPTSPLDSTGNESSAGTTVQPKKIRGLGFGDIFKEGSVKLKSRLSNSESEDKKSEKQSIPASNTEIVKNEPENKHKGEYCKAVFAYEATNPDELSIKEGDHILLISKDTGDRGWWKGELNGKQGVFPDNFVVMVSETGREKPKKPLPPTKVQVTKPEPPPAEKKIELKKVLPDKIDMLATRTDEKDDQKSAKPSAPMVPPKKPGLPMKHHPFKSATPPKRPEKPTVPPPLSKVNGEVPCNRPKSDLDSAVFRPKPEISIRPKSTEIVIDKASDIDLISFDTVESSSEKLTHPTASRPRLPGRRPPSVFMVSGESHLDKKAKSFKEDEEETAKPKPSEIIKKPSFKQNTGIMNATEVKEMTEVDDRGKTTIEDIKAQIADLMALVETLKIQHKKELIELRLEFEEEKKHRISLQLEVDKLKKAVQPP